MSYEREGVIKRRDALIAVSLANLCFIRVWNDLLALPESSSFFIKEPTSSITYLATIGSVLLLATVFTGLRYIVRKSNSAVAREVMHFGFLLMLIVPVMGILRVLSLLSTNVVLEMQAALLATIGEGGILLAGFTLLLLTIFILLKWRRQAVTVATYGILICFPFVILTYSKAIYAIANLQSLHIPSDQPSTALLHRQGAAPRVIWLIFDELDFRLVFSNRPPTIELPEFDLLRKESFFATNALPPGAKTTISIPSLLTGRRFSQMESVRADDLRMSSHDEVSLFSDIPNIFTEAYGIGFNTAVVGYFLPYSRLIQTGLTFSKWYEMPTQRNSLGEGLFQIMFNEVKSLLETPRFSPWGNSLVTNRYIQLYNSMLRDVKELVANPDIHLLFVHFPIPHVPYIYDRAQGIARKSSPLFLTASSEREGYLDNLALVDRTVKELRQVLNRSRLWDETTVIISSDHSWRYAGRFGETLDPRIPFVVRLAGESNAVVYEKQFNTVVTADLILAILNGKVRSHQHISKWIDATTSQSRS